MCLGRLSFVLYLHGMLQSSFLTTARRIHEEQKTSGPPVPRLDGAFPNDYDPAKIDRSFENWTPKNKQHAWELSGLYEGDIMIHPEDDAKTIKNGLLDANARWPGAVVPYHIEESDFVADEVAVIEGAMMEYKEKTCVRFRPYEDADEDFVLIKSDGLGCWSSVGRKSRGQVLNLHRPKCVRHGIVLHELMHAIGFYHQQSAADRDDWVQIHWANIMEGKEHNFNKYDNGTVTDYQVGYDYKSIMHYSGHAFSKNDEPTITPTREKVTLGQRKSLTAKDIAKIAEMYRDECAAREATGNGDGSSSASSSSEENGTLDWLFG